MTPATEFDWAMQEALEEVDAIGWAAPPVAPRRLTEAEIAYYTGLRNVAGRCVEVNATMNQLRNYSPARFGHCEFCGAMRPSEELELYCRTGPVKYKRCQACKRGHGDL